MLFKAVFIAVLLYFAFVAIRNLIIAVRADTLARHRHRVDPRREVHRDVPPEWRHPREERVPRPTVRPRTEEDIQDAKWKDV